MSQYKRGLLLLATACAAALCIGCYFMGWISPLVLEKGIEHTGLWAPVVFILLYAVATALLMPSTPINLMGGVLFGIWYGIFWTGIAAIVAAILTFAFTRSVGHELVAQKMAGRWQSIDREVRRGGRFYIFAVRLLPLIPNGLINYGAGLTSISARDYLIGTIPGTVLGILPPVLIGSSGLKAIKNGNLFPLIGAMALMGLFVLGATWYRRQRDVVVEATDATEA